MVTEIATNPLADAIASMIEQALAPYAEEVAYLRSRVDSLGTRNAVAMSEIPPGCLTWEQAQAKRFLSIKQTAFILGISDKSVRRKIDDGLIKVSKGLRHIRIPVEEIDAYQKRTV